MMREKSYAASHKGLRNAIGQFALLAGKTDYHDLPSVQRLQSLGDELFELLSHHLQTENEHFLKAIEARVPGAGHHDMDDHVRLEKLQEAVQLRLQDMDGTQDPEAGHQFYLAFTHFQSEYLAHILEEELVTEKLLLDNFSEAEMIAIRNQIMQSVEFPVILQSLKYIMPAQTQAENVTLLRALKANAPQEALDAVLEVIGSVMPQQEFQQLVAAL